MGIGKEPKLIPTPAKNPYNYGLRYSQESDALFIVKPSLWFASPNGEKERARLAAPKQTGKNAYNRPIFVQQHILGLSLIPWEELSSQAGQAANVMNKINVKGWPIPAISNPEQVQIVVFMAQSDAAKGKNVVSTTVNFPKPMDEIIDNILDPIKDWGLPVAVVLGLAGMGLGLLKRRKTGLVGGATAKSDASDNDSKEDNDAEPEKERQDDEVKEEAQPRLQLNRPSIVIIENSDTHPPLNGRIIGGESADEWQFSLSKVDSIENAVASFDCKAINSSSCELAIKTVKVPKEAGRSMSSSLFLTAINRKTQKELTAELTVIAARQGLILTSESPIKIAADGETETEISITAITAFDGKISTDFDMFKGLSFNNKIETDCPLAQKAFSTARPMFRGNGEGAGWRNLRGFERDEPAEYVFKVRTSILLPGQGESYYGTAKICDGQGEPLLLIPIMLDVDLMQNQSRAWEIELERCKTIIKKLPEQHQGRLNAFVDERAAFLGAEGLYRLRHDIWRAGQALWEAESLGGYEGVERWAGFIERTLNFAQWSGRLATDILIANRFKLGIFAAMAVGEIYNLSLTCIQCYRANKTFDQWVDDYFLKDLQNLLLSMGAAALEPDALMVQLGKNRRAMVLAWSIQFAYHFLSNLTVHKLSVVDAAKRAATTVVIAAGMKQMVRLASQKLGPKAVNAPEDLDKNAAMGWQNAKQKVTEFERAVKSGHRSAIRDRMLEIQSDKFALKEINLWPDEVKLAYNKEISKLYASIDGRVKKKILQDLRKQGFEVTSKDLTMTNATNAVNKVKVGSDRDISVEYSIFDKRGRKISVEYPREKLGDIYGRELYRSVGTRKAEGMLPGELMDKFDQYCIDSTDAEAYGMRRIKYSTGVAENVDFVRALNKDGLAEKFDDGGQIGQTVAYKAKHWFNKASDALAGGKGVDSEAFKMEGMSQLVKQFKNIYEPRRGVLADLGVRQAEDGALKQMIGLMEKAVGLEKSPAYVEKLVKEQGFSSLNAFADALGDKIASLNRMM
jgi:hypothetical protein